MNKGTNPLLQMRVLFFLGYITVIVFTPVSIVPSNV